MYCDNCIHKEVCGKEGCGDPAMTFCDDRITGAIPVEWIEEWVKNYCNSYEENLIKCLLKTWRKENATDRC